MEDMDVQRVIGKLEEGFRQVTENHRLLNHTLANFSDKIQEIQAKHNSDDARFQTEIVARLTAIESLSEHRLTAIESLSETVESHGSAIVDLEQRVSEQEDMAEIKARIKKRDTNWIKVLVVCVFILVGDKFTGSKLSEWVSLLFK